MASGALEAAEPEGAAAPPLVEGKEELPEKLEVEEIEPWFRFWSSEISKDQFHSKSVATCHGRQIFENFRGITEDYWLRSSSSFFRRRYAHFTARIQVPHGNHISGQVRLTNTPSVEINGDHLLQEVTRSRRPVYDLDERNCLGMSNLGTSPATIDMKLLKLTWRRLEGLAARLGGAKNIFCELFSDNKAENTFWLDSSSIEKVCLEEEECTFQFGSLFMSFLWKM
ncbi:aminodeoxychorismate synthase, chloroplastic-like isoform X3 [Syzygium oleosum]|uniref:aminodeoxychorismate synthase, chloroplastic-like isoform X3 n=1 Tax=Syzygium oleosum TaxID=219896 RepID=UPI0024BA69C3|nr:aminodeoxychorismate synthase, chloroplastic-like isoform X3 [Syzygium oleosum]